MLHDSSDLLPPRIAIIDDEKQVHASIRLRLGQSCELVSFYEAQSALEAVGTNKFDLCFVDIHMPGMDGLAFIDAAIQRDPTLGFVVLSAFDTQENLRRMIPLQAYEFIAKPLPEREGFEARIPEWITRTRQRRREQSLAQQAGGIGRDLHVAQLEREVELVAGESARAALSQTATLLTTVHAHLVTACIAIAARAKTDASFMPLLRNLETGRKTAEAAAVVAEGFFDSAYGNRDTSPALVDSGIVHAIGIASRMCRAEEAGKTIDFTPLDVRLPVRGLSGVDFLLMMFPLIGAALQCSGANTTVGIRGELFPRLDTMPKDSRYRDFLWVNRRHALGSHAAVAVFLTAAGPPFSRPQTEAWLNGEDLALSLTTPHGLIAGLKKCKGLLGFSLSPHSEKFSLVIGLPT